MFKKLFVTALFISQSLLPSFAAILDENEFKTSWDYSPVIKRKDGNSELQMKLFKKTMWFGQTEVPVVETTFTYLKNPKDYNEKTGLKDLAQTIQKTFGKGMILKSGDHLYKIEGPFKKLNRQVKIDLKSVDKSVLIVTSFIRLGFNKNVNSEVEELHKTLLTYRGEATEHKTTWMNWIHQFVLKDANAEGLNLGGLLGGSNTTSSPTPAFNFVLDTSSLTNSVNTLNTSVNNTNVQLGNANANWGVTNGQLGNANTNWNNTNGVLNNTNVQLGNANNNWNNTNVQIGNANNNWNNTNNTLNNTNVQLGNANNNWNNTNTQLANANVNMANFNKEYGNMNTNWAESNKLMASMLDPNHMAKVAFYTAAGAALGGVAVNLAIQGVSSGISFLYELFTGTKKKKLEWEYL